MRFLKVLHVVFIFLAILQVVNIAVEKKYMVKDALFHAEYDYSKNRISETEYKAALVDIENKKKEVIIYEVFNWGLLVINIFFLLLWEYQAMIKNKKTELV